MNKVFLIGNLCADPDHQYVAGGTVARSTFRLAVQRRFVNAQGVKETDFFTVVCWKALAENVAGHLKKGSRVAVDGSVQTRSYDKDGTKRYVTEVVAEQVQFLSRAEEKKEAAGTRPDEGLKPDYMPNEFVEIEDDELPF